MLIKKGDKFGSLEVISFYTGKRESGSVKRMVKCKCKCGRIVDVEKYNLTSGNSKRCINCKSKIVGASRSTHGHSYNNKNVNKLEAKCYYTWQAIKRRCRKTYDLSYERYGGKGIDVCDDWFDSYESFLSDMGLPPSVDSQIDRTDNSKGYSKENCRWVSRSQNSRNKSNNRKITAFGATKLLCEWAESYGVNSATIARRIDSLNWSPEQAIIGKESRFKYKTPDGKFRALKEVSSFYGLSSSGSHSRFKSKAFPSWEFIN